MSAALVPSLPIVRKAIGEKAVQRVIDAGFSIQRVPKGTKLSTISPSLKNLRLEEAESYDSSLGVTFADVHERSIYLLVDEPFTLAHELGHALDYVFDLALDDVPYNEYLHVKYGDIEPMRIYTMKDTGEFIADCLAAYSDVGSKCDCCLKPIMHKRDLIRMSRKMYDWAGRVMEKANA